MNTSRKVVVTGATGFLGEKVVERLKKLHYFPVAVGRNQSKERFFIDQGIPFISLDLTEKQATIDALKGSQFVIHCAALSSVWGSFSDFEKANILAVENVIEACKIQGVQRLIHISTPSLYFDYQDKYNLTEEHPLSIVGVNAYAKSKKIGEELVKKAFNEGLSTVILRPRGIFGPGDTSILPRILKAIEKNRFFLVNEGKALMDITYVDNVVDAIILAMEVEKAQGQVYNITNDEPKFFLDLITYLTQKIELPLELKNISFKKAFYMAKCLEIFYKFFRIKKEPPLTCYGVGLLSTSMTFDISKAKKELGYRPKISIKEGLDAFILSRGKEC